MSFELLPQEVRDLIMSYWSPMRDLRERIWMTDIRYFEMLDVIAEVENPRTRQTLLWYYYDSIQNDLTFTRIMICKQIRNEPHPFGRVWMKRTNWRCFNRIL